jgi:hypothetical protein
MIGMVVLVHDVVRLNTSGFMHQLTVKGFDKLPVVSAAGTLTVNMHDRADGIDGYRESGYVSEH